LQDLFNNNVDFNDVFKRNIVSLRKSEDLFDDLSDSEEARMIARSLESEAKKGIPTNIIDRGFHYTTAIEYPFVNESYLQSRYGTGEFPVWYGSLDLDTTIYETAYHMFQEENKVHDNDNVIFRERAIYDVSCSAILIDLRGKEKDYPDIVANHYSFTQSIAKRIYQEGHPGLMVPSARRAIGANGVIFLKSVLSNPKLKCYLNYTLIRNKSKVIVERTPGKTYLEVNF
jgi:hypothetical protein